MALPNAGAALLIGEAVPPTPSRIMAGSVSSGLIVGAGGPPAQYPVALGVAGKSGLLVGEGRVPTEYSIPLPYAAEQYGGQRAPFNRVPIEFPVTAALATGPSVVIWGPWASCDLALIPEED